MKMRVIKMPSQFIEGKPRWAIITDQDTFLDEDGDDATLVNSSAWLWNTRKEAIAIMEELRAK